MSTDGAHELLHFDASTGHPVRSFPRDEPWASWTCTLGFPVMGIWPRSKPGEKAMDGTDINAACRGKAHGEWCVCRAYNNIKSSSRFKMRRAQSYTVTDLGYVPNSRVLLPHI
eukprot:122405-Pyramimonas_sp.AAC.1